jgi:hypothetical protein
MAFHQALEYVAATTVFTTHTPVAAGHDIFEQAIIQTYLASYCQANKIDWQEFLQLGSSPGYETSFNMTALALRDFLTLVKEYESCAPRPRESGHSSRRRSGKKSSKN